MSLWHILRCILWELLLVVQIYLRLHDNPLSDKNDKTELEQENLTPAELKKLKNKMRKKAKKEAMKKEQEKQEEQKREANKAKNQEADTDGPKEEELVPEKLARVRDSKHSLVPFCSEKSASLWGWCACLSLCTHRISSDKFKVACNNQADCPNLGTLCLTWWFAIHGTRDVIHDAWCPCWDKTNSSFVVTTIWIIRNVHVLVVQFKHL